MSAGLRAADIYGRMGFVVVAGDGSTADMLHCDARGKTSRALVELLVEGERSGASMLVWECDADTFKTSLLDVAWYYLWHRGGWGLTRLHNPDKYKSLLSYVRHKHHLQLPNAAKLVLLHLQPPGRFYEASDLFPGAKIRSIPCPDEAAFHSLLVGNALDNRD